MNKEDVAIASVMMVTSLVFFLISAWSAPSWATGFALSFWIYNAARNTIKNSKRPTTESEELEDKKP